MLFFFVFTVNPAVNYQQPLLHCAINGLNQDHAQDHAQGHAQGHAQEQAQDCAQNQAQD